MSVISQEQEPKDTFYSNVVQKLDGLRLPVSEEILGEYEAFSQTPRLSNTLSFTQLEAYAAQRTDMPAYATQIHDTLQSMIRTVRDGKEPADSIHVLKDILMELGVGPATAQFAVRNVVRAVYQTHAELNGPSLG